MNASQKRLDRLARAIDAAAQQADIDGDKKLKASLSDAAGSSDDFWVHLHKGSPAMAKDALRDAKRYKRLPVVARWIEVAEAALRKSQPGSSVADPGPSGPLFGGAS